MQSGRAPHRGVAGLPVRLQARLLARRRPLGSGFVLLTGTAIAYAAVVLVLYLARAEMTVPPWLVIPDADYYLWESVFIGPLIILLWVMVSGIAHLLARIASGGGSYERTLAVMALAIALPTWATLIPDAITGLLFWTDLLPQARWLEMTDGVTPWSLIVWTYLGLYLAGLLVLASAGVRLAQGLSWKRAIPIGVSTAILYGFALFIFVR